MFNKTANEPMRADKAIPSCMNTFLSKSQIISGAPGQKNFDREEFTRGSSDILTFMSTYNEEPEFREENHMLSDEIFIEMSLY